MCISCHIFAKISFKFYQKIFILSIIRLFSITLIFSVLAHDADKGRNGEIRYTFSQDSLDLADVFSIDTYTGWITNLVHLDKETKSEYRFHVTATDNGHPKHSARTTVIVKVKDYNDQPSLFKRKFYEAAVNEDAWPGK